MVWPDGRGAARRLRVGNRQVEHHRSLTQWRSERAGFRLKLEGVRSNTVFSSDMTTSIRVPMPQRLSLRVGLHWIYNNLPALEDIDLVAQLIVVDRDGIPGNGDEYFETVESGGAPVDLGSVQERKEKLDTVFTTSWGIRF